MENQLQTESQLDDFPQQWPDQLKGMPAEVSRILDISRTITQLSSLVTDLERMAKRRLLRKARVTAPTAREKQCV